MISRSLNTCWGYCLDSFHSLAFERDSGDGEFKEDQIPSLGLTNTMSGLADVTRMSGGMVEWGLSLARPGRSEYSFFPRLNMSSKSKGQLIQGTVSYSDWTVMQHCGGNISAVLSLSHSDDEIFMNE